jgi:hypothetical protein
MFEIPQRTATIVIPEGDFKGAEIVASRDIPLSLYLTIEDSAGTSRGVIKAVTDFASSVLVSWNLSRNGEAIPATAEEMLRLPPDLVTAIMTAWVESLKGTPPPLVEPSEDGSQSEKD